MPDTVATPGAHKGRLCAKNDLRPGRTVVNRTRADPANARAQFVKDSASLALRRLPREKGVPPEPNRSAAPRVIP